jgi:hypothetical protein
MELVILYVFLCGVQSSISMTISLMINREFFVSGALKLEEVAVLSSNLNFLGELFHFFWLVRVE